MYIQKPSGTVNHETTRGIGTENAAAGRTGKPMATPPTASVKTPSAPHSVSSLLAAAGLPADKLSVSIVAFSRFFSLPLKPELLAAIRRQTLSPSPTQRAETAMSGDTVKAFTISDGNTVEKNRAALSLAATAAESKGVELDQKGLEGFAEAIDPDRQKRQDSGEQRRGRRDKNQGEQEAGKTSPITGDSVKEMALAEAGKNPLLEILNRLPDKNGRRWIVLPFDFCKNSREYRVSLRVLLDNSNLNGSGLMALDIAETGENEQRWLFALSAPPQRLTVYLQPGSPLPALDTVALASIMDIKQEQISVKYSSDLFPAEGSAEGSYGEELLPTINKAV